MTDIREQLNGDPLPWLLEKDPDNPGVRYFALRDLMRLPVDSIEVKTAHKAVMSGGPVPAILAHQQRDGYWIKPGYLPKYNGTMWSIIFLAQLGADGREPHIRRACDHLFDYAVAEHGGLSMDGRNGGLIHRLQGNLCTALLEFGYLDDDRLQRALDWLARSITGEGIAPSTEKTAPVHYLRSGNSAPGFECSANNHQPCAWGAVKALLALLSLISGDWKDEGALDPLGVLVTVLLLTGLGTAGLAAERRLPIDLFPLLRRKEARRILYVLVAAFFLALLVQMWGGIWGDVAAGLGRAVGERPPVETGAAAQFDASHPLTLFLNFLIGAGLFEELLFRVGIMTPVWALTRRWGWGLLVSALAFGLYHISPMSGMAAYYLQAPLTAVVQSFGVGLAMGLIYRYRGFLTAVMTHALGNWLVVMILFGP